MARIDRLINQFLMPHNLDSDVDQSNNKTHQSQAFDFYQDTFFLNQLSPWSEQYWQSHFNNHVDSHREILHTSRNLPIFVDENDAERSLASIAIDPKSEQIASMTTDSDLAENLGEVHYEVLRVPLEHPECGGRHVYRDRYEYHFCDTKERISDDVCHVLIREPIDRVTLRPLQDGEMPRPNFRVNWKKR